MTTEDSQEYFPLLNISCLYIELKPTSSMKAMILLRSNIVFKEIVLYEQNVMQEMQAAKTHATKWVPENPHCQK